MARFEKSPPPYDPNAQNGQQQHQGDGQPPQGCSQPAGYQPVPQGYGQQYGIQPAYGGQPQQHVVIAQPAPTVIVASQPRPFNYLVPAIFACICCFWPTGICAIIAASNANSAADSGDMARAKKKSRIARNLLIVTVVLGVICCIITLVYQVKYKKSSARGYNYNNN